MVKNILPGWGPVAAEALEAGLVENMPAAHVLQTDMVEPGREAGPVPITRQANEPLKVTQILPDNQDSHEMIPKNISLPNFACPFPL